MDPSRDIMESAKPPRPPKPGAPSGPVDHERWMRLLLGVVAMSTVATAVLAGIAAWETHQDRVNTETIYCTLFLGSEPPPGDETSGRREMMAQLNC